MELKKGLKIVFWLSIVAIILFAYLVKVHYQEEASSFCDISQGVSCDIVNKSIYSEIFGIPVSLMGMLTFIIVAIIITPGIRKKIGKKLLLKILLAVLVISTLFSLWLVYAELFLILSICLLCVAADILILAMLFILIRLNKKNIDKRWLNIAMTLFIVADLIVLYLIWKIITEV